MRIVVGFLLMCHGAQKLFGLLGGMVGEGGTAALMSHMGAGGVIEFFGGLAIALGIFTGWAAFLASGMMAVGYFQFHQPHGGLPIHNRGELAVVYAFLFLYIASHGSGIWNLGSKFGKS